MQHFFKKLRHRLVRKAPTKPLTIQRARQAQIVVPEAVGLPLPKGPREEISVPASINGRDLSTGRL